MKKFIFLLVLFVTLTSCSEYSKILNKGDVKSQYKLAEDLFNEGKYSKAIVLFEKIAPSFTNKPQMQRIRYMNGLSNYKLENYETASYHFNRFINSYPKSTKLEEVYYLNTQSLYQLSPRSSIDQEETNKALEFLQTYLDKYPNAEHTEMVNNQYKALVDKLNFKAYNIAYLYYKTEHYKTAIVAFDNYLSNYLGTKYKEDALFYKFKSAYMLGMKSVEYKKLQRLKDAIKAQKRYAKYFPNSTKYKKESEKLLKDLEKEIEIMNANKIVVK